MVSLEGLSKIVDPSQLTADFEGSLEYNHDDWIEVSNFYLLLFEKHRVTQDLIFVFSVFT